MTPEAQRIAIAEACGKQVIYWRVDYNNHGRTSSYIAKTEEAANSWPFRDGGIHLFVNVAAIPDYLADLNAMHEAEAVLDDRQQQCRNYVEELEHVLIRAHEMSLDPSRFGMLHATAAQRAEAFLRTLGKWQPKPEGEAP
jgi:acyl-CoA thioesterase FadM